MRSDQDEIQDLARHYARSVDLRDFTLIPRLFTPDAELVVTGAQADEQDAWYRMIGIEQIEAGLRQITLYPVTFHVLGQQLLLERSDDAARTETYCTAYHYYQREGEELEYIMFIRYLDDLVRNEGQWRIRHRRLLVQHTRGVPADSD